MKNIAILLLGFLLTTLSNAQTFDDISKEANNSINIGYIGSIQTVSYSINYEHLFNNRHGFVVGMPIVNSLRGKEYGFSLSYRNHWKNKMSSPFWGVFLDFSKIELSAIEYRNGKVINEYLFTNSATAIGANIGRKWVTNFGVNITARIGCGIPISNFQWIDIPPDETEFVEISEVFFKVASAFDAEISIGYCF